MTALLQPNFLLALLLTFLCACQGPVDDLHLHLHQNEAINLFHQRFVEFQDIQKMRYHNYSRAERSLLEQKEKRQNRTYQNALWEAARDHHREGQTYDQAEWQGYKEQLRQRYFSEDVLVFRQQQQQWMEQYALAKNDLEHIVQTYLVPHYPELEGVAIYNVFNWLHSKNLLPPE